MRNLRWIYLRCAEKILRDRLFRLVEEGKVDIALNSTAHEILGDARAVTGLKIVDALSGQQRDLSVQGAFVAIGPSSNTDALRGQIDMRDGYIQVKGGAFGSATATNIPGVAAWQHWTQRNFSRKLQHVESNSMITCHIRYVLDPSRIEDFERYGKLWIALVKKHGGIHHGYLLPSEGASNIALASFSFPSLTDYAVYRTKVFSDPECLAASKYGEETRCFFSYERTFFRPVFE